MADGTPDTIVATPTSPVAELTDFERFDLWLAETHPIPGKVSGWSHAMWMRWCGLGRPSPRDLPSPLVAYCDGSGTVADQPSGAGVVVLLDGVVILEASRSLGNGTNNHAEISAVRIALAVTNVPGLTHRHLIVRTDSLYTINALTAAAHPAPHRPNAKLIVYTRQLLVRRRVRFEHVKGHSGEPGNERADLLAGLARRRQLAPPSGGA